MVIPNFKHMFTGIVRDAPVIAAIINGKNDYFMISGSSVRVRDLRSGYFRFIINAEEDIERLTKNILPELDRVIAVDEGYEKNWRILFPDANFRHFRLTVLTRDMFNPLPDIKLPEEMQTVHIDESWEPLILELCEDEEFSADDLRCQLRENLSLGLMHRGERIGFMSTHLNGETGPLWIAPEYRSGNLGTAFLRDYFCEYLKSNAVAFALSEPENHATARIMEKLGFRIWDKYVLLITRALGA